MERAELSELAQHAQQTVVAAEVQKERELRMHGFRGLPVAVVVAGEPQGVLDMDCFLYSTKSSPSQVN